MKALDYIILAVLALWLCGAVGYVISRKKKRHCICYGGCKGEEGCPAEKCRRCSRCEEKK